MDICSGGEYKKQTASISIQDEQVAKGARNGLSGGYRLDRLEFDWLTAAVRPGSETAADEKTAACGLTFSRPGANSAVPDCLVTC